MPVQHAIAVTVAFNGKSVEFTISQEFADHCVHEISRTIRESTESTITDSEIEGVIALELSGYIDAGLTSDKVRTLAAEDTAYILAAMLSTQDWVEAEKIEFYLMKTDHDRRLDLRLILISCADRPVMEDQRTRAV